MKDNKTIGKKVWVIKEDTTDRTKVWTIVSIKNEKEAKDWCKHLILRADDGEEKEVREYECIFIPDETLPEIDMISRYLNDNGCGHDDVYHKNEQLCVYISWGDWKHSFIWLDNLMRYIGYDLNDEEVTEENGSDCYSAIHYYKKSA